MTSKHPTNQGRAKISRASKITNGVGDVAGFVLSVKGIIDLAVQSVPQAALPWAGVCVGLQVSSRPSNTALCLAPTSTNTLTKRSQRTGKNFRHSHWWMEDPRSTSSRHNSSISLGFHGGTRSKQSWSTDHSRQSGVCRETEPLDITVEGKTTRVISDSVDIGPKKDMILGRPWHRTNDPDISWKGGGHLRPRSTPGPHPTNLMGNADDGS